MQSRAAALNEIARDLDISPSDFLLAQTRYQAIGDWLSNGWYGSGWEPKVYVQGSFRLGTVVKPFRGGREQGFDVDQVIELRKRSSTVTPRGLKHDIGDRLKEHGSYERMLRPEGRRCWTIQYAEDGSRPEFHVDVLPAINAVGASTTRIDITNKAGDAYSWSSSDPNGFYQWFKSKNAISEELSMRSRTAILEESQDIFESVDQVPKQLVRTALQRAIQIVKRHRDVYFDGKEQAPSSITITTILAKVFRGGGVDEALEGFAKYVCSRHDEVMSGVPVAVDGILDFQEGKWVIENPADPEENFADKWNSDPKLAAAFFLWGHQLSRDVYGFSQSGVPGDLWLGVGSSEEEKSFPALHLRAMAKVTSLGAGSYTDDLLRLIHLGVNRRVEWKAIEGLAKKRKATMGAGFSDVDWVNFYQIALHQRKALPAEGIQHVRQILSEHVHEPDFVLCCNLLLGNATRQMFQRCIQYKGSGSEVMGWPIVLLAPEKLLVPPMKIRAG